MKNILFCLLCSAFLVSCAMIPRTPRYAPSPTITERLGEFNVASSFNVQNLNYDLSGNTFTNGEHCVAKVRPQIRTVVVTDDSGKRVERNEIVEEKGTEGRLKIAMDIAIRNGRKKGIAGDVLVNVRINRLTKDGGQNKPKLDCYYVEGDLVAIKAKQ